jgi:glycosyltransferase involved in cell wall biosynthesis
MPAPTAAARIATARPIRAAVVAQGNPRDVATWSGTPFHMLAALEPHFDLVAVIEKPWPWWYSGLGKALKALTWRRFDYNFSPRFTGFAARRTMARLAAAQPDVVFALSFSPMAHLLVDRFRTVNVADATLQSMAGYYDIFMHSLGGRFGAADAIEAKTIGGAFLSLYPSAWARDSAVNDYGASPSRARMIEWGPNVSAVAATPRTLPAGAVRLLFVGVDFARKGGPLAIAIAEDLTARGIACRLDIVGVNADVLGSKPLPANVVFHGFVSKASAAGSATLEQLFAAASFFLLPASAECFGMVFAEAASRGLPSIGFATGGVPSAVLSGVTGMLLPLGADARAFADTIAALVADPERYAALSRAALADSQTRLNWNVWGQGVHDAVAQQLDADGAAGAS